MAILAVLGLGACHGPLHFVPQTLLDAKVGVPYAVRVSVTESHTPVGGIDVPQAELPPGLSLSFTRTDEAAELRGIPTRAGSYHVKVSAWCYGTNFAGQTGSHEYTLVVH